MQDTKGFSHVEITLVDEHLLVVGHLPANVTKVYITNGFLRRVAIDGL